MSNASNIQQAVRHSRGTQTNAAHAMTDFGQAAATMVLSWGTMAWTALYSNSDSAAAAVFPLLLGAGLIRSGAPSGQPRLGFLKNFCAKWKMWYAGFMWVAAVAVGLWVCISLNKAVTGYEVEVQLATPDGNVSFFDGRKRFDTAVSGM